MKRAFKIIAWSLVIFLMVFGAYAVGCSRRYDLGHNVGTKPGKSQGAGAAMNAMFVVCKEGRVIFKAPDGADYYCGQVISL